MGVSVRAAAVSAAAAVLVAGVAGLGALAAPAATAAPAVRAPAAPAVPAGPRWAPAATAAIRPGALTETAGAGACTSNFVFTGAGGRVLLGQAAHCAGTGDSSEVDGCTAATRPVGTAVTIRAAGGDRRGTLVYSSWVTMQANGETDPDTCAYNDFALVELEPADAAEVNPSLPHFGGPTGLDADGLTSGGTVFTYGRTSGARMPAPKAGVSASDVGGGWGHEVRTLDPGAPGDSGSAFVDATGRAVGVLSTLNLAPLPVSNGGTDLARAMGYAARHGGVEGLALVNGTEPFTTTPPGVPAEDLATPNGPGAGLA